jgi:hypothetical protein
MALINSLAARVTDRRVVLFHQNDGDTGAVLLSAAVVLKRPMEAWAVTQEDLAFGTPDLNNGLCLELNWYTQDDIYCTNPLN